MYLITEQVFSHRITYCSLWFTSFLQRRKKVFWKGIKCLQDGNVNPGTSVPTISISTALLLYCDCLLPSVDLQCQNTGATVLVFSSHCVDPLDALQIRPNNPEVKGEVHAFPWVAPWYVFLAFNATAWNTGLHFGLPDFANDSLPKLSANSSALVVGKAKSLNCHTCHRILGMCNLLPVA